MTQHAKMTDVWVTHCGKQERGAWRLRITDMEVCGYIDRVLLPETGIQSYTMLDSRQLPSVINAVQRKFHIRDEQILRCLGLHAMPNVIR